MSEPVATTAQPEDIVTAASGVGARPAVWRDYLALTKPTIMLLVLITGLTSLVVESSMYFRPWDALLVILGLMLTGGCANALNQYFERERDAQMVRTRKRRPLPQGRIEPRNALIFSIALGIGAIALFAIRFNWLSAGLALFTIIFYSFFYTLILKPRTEQNIVIGGVAGAMAPPIAWAAMSGTVAAPAWVMFAIIFLWTPPHFWSLALLFKEDYRKVDYPMLPVIRGDSATRKQIFRYTLALLGISAIPELAGSGWIYLVIAAGLGYGFYRLSWRMWREQTNSYAGKLFGYSIIYLFGLFIALMMDAGAKRWL